MQILIQYNMISIQERSKIYVGVDLNQNRFFIGGITITNDLKNYLDQLNNLLQRILSDYRKNKDTITLWKQYEEFLFPFDKS